MLLHLAPSIHMVGFARELVACPCALDVRMWPTGSKPRLSSIALHLYLSPSGLKDGTKLGRSLPRRLLSHSRTASMPSYSFILVALITGPFQYRLFCSESR